MSAGGYGRPFPPHRRRFRLIIMMMMGPGSGFMFGPLIPILLLAGALYVGWKLYNHRAWGERTERPSENDGRVIYHFLELEDSGR